MWLRHYPHFCQCLGIVGEFCHSLSYITCSFFNFYSKLCHHDPAFYYFNTSQFVSISSGLKFLISKFTIVIPCLIAIHFVCSFELMRRVIRLVILYPFLLLTRSKSTSYLDPYQQNDMFIGQSQFEMLFVGPLAYIVSIGFVSLVHNLVFILFPNFPNFVRLAAKNTPMLVLKQLILIHLTFR